MLYGGDKLSLKSKFKNNKVFDNLFGFESGVDITDETKVLYRRNNVIKRIIFLSNLVFSGLFALLSFGEKSNILLTIILFPLTYYSANSELYCIVLHDIVINRNLFKIKVWFDIIFTGMWIYLVVLFISHLLFISK